MKFPTKVPGFNLAEIVKTGNASISNQNDVKRVSDCEVRLDIEVNLIGC